MPAFDALIEAQLSGATVRFAALAEFDFRSGVRRYWTGFTQLNAAGVVWEGAAGLGAVSQVVSGFTEGADEMVFRLAGPAAMLQSFQDDVEETYGRNAFLFLQFFRIDREDGEGNWVEWDPLGEPIQIGWGIMGPPQVSRPPVYEGDPATRFIEVRAVNALLNRRRPPLAFYTHTEQQVRSPGDQMFRNIPDFVEAAIHWPEP